MKVKYLCCCKVSHYDKSNQVPSISPTTDSSRPSLPRTDQTTPSPPPTSKGFEVNGNTDQYASIWDNYAKLSSTFEQSLQTVSNRIEHHQKETINTKWTKKSSTNFDSAHIESIVNTQTHACMNLSTSEKIDELMNNLNHIHKQQDERIKRRTQQISTEIESILAHIINETQQEQQRLLCYAKKQQTEQDEHYREVLQKYISKIDETKAEQLAQLQKELRDGQERIMQVSQIKIMTVSEQANGMKSKIVKEEQQQASMKIDGVNVRLQNLSTDETFQQLGSEIMTKTNVITNSKVGSKAAGQNCSSEFVEDALTENNNTGEHARQLYTKTMYSDTTSRRRSDHEVVITQIGKKVPINPTAQIHKSR